MPANSRWDLIRRLRVKAIRLIIMKCDVYLVETREGKKNPCKILVGKSKCERYLGVGRKIILKGILNKVKFSNCIYLAS